MHIGFTHGRRGTTTAASPGVGNHSIARLAPSVAFALLMICLLVGPRAEAAETRHFEKVSPDDKAGSDIVGDSLTTIAAEEGDAVAFTARAQFAGAVGSGAAGQTDYVARRGADGTWTTRAVTPMARPDAVQTLYTKTRLDLFSDDLRTAFVSGYDLPEAPDAQEDRMNFYVENTDDGALEPLVLSSHGPLFFFDFSSGNDIWGLSDDARHAAFQTFTSLLPGVPPGTKVYQWDDGELRLAGVLPDGTATTSDVFPTNYRDTISADGSRLAFRSPAGSSGQLYLRIDGETTHWISQPEGSDQSTPTGVILRAMSPDGRIVFFVSDSQLLDEDTNFGPDLYRYTDSADPENDENLTMISQNGDAGISGVPEYTAGVIGFSDDGQIVYHHTASDEVAVWDHGDRTAIASGTITPPAVQKTSLTVTASQPGMGRVTPDGSYAAFLVNDTADTVHGPTGEVTNGHYQMYLYSRDEDELICVSCPPGGASSDVAIVPTVTSGFTLTKLAIRPNFLSDDGQVFFSSDEALVPEDVNGVMDTYQYDAPTGELSLLTTGRGSEPAMFADASRDGDDVFVVTAQQLSPDDTDPLVDLYDVRVGEGPPPAPESPGSGTCDGDACQGDPASSPGSPALGSTAAGDGNFVADEQQASLLRVLRPKPTSGRRATVEVRTSSAGVISVRGRSIRNIRRKVSKPGRYRLRVRLDRRAKRKLAAGRRVKARSRVVFRPETGERVSRTVRLLFRPASGKRG